MKTCPNCKAQLEDDVVFCNECGTKVDSAPAQAEPASSDATSNAAPAGNSILENAAQTTKNSNIGIIAVAAAALVLIVILVALLGGGGGAKGAIKSYFAALEKGDTDKLITAMVPKAGLEDYIDDMYDADYKDYVKAYDAFYKVMWSGLKKEGKVKLDYEIKTIESVKKLDKLKKDAKNIGISDLDDVQDLLDDWMDDYGVDADKVKEAYVAEVKYTLEADGEKILKDDGICLIYKYSGKYYVLGDLPTADDIISEIVYDDDLLDKFEDMLLDAKDLVEDDYEDELSSLSWYFYYVD